MMIRKGFISLVLLVCLCASAQGQTFTFECLGEYISGAECPECTGQTSARLFNGLMIKRSGAYFKNIDCPYIVKVQGSNLIFQEILNPNPETVTINRLSTGFSTMTGFRDSTACMCARQDSSWIGGGGGDPSITNEGILGVAAGGANDALLTSNTSTAVGVTYAGSTTIQVTETTSTNGGTILFRADTSLLATVTDAITNLTYTGASSPVTLNSSTGTDVTVTAGAGISLAATATDLTITNTGDLSATNEAWTVDADDADTELITTQTVKFQGAGINATDYDAATNVLLITGTEVDGSITNELQTITNTSDATSHTVTLSSAGGSVQLIEGSNITLTTGGTASAGTVTIASTGGGTNYQTIRDDGVDETQRAALNFVSTSTVNAVGTDDAGNNETEIALNVPTDGITATEIAAGAVGTSEIATNAVANADFRQSEALSVVGNATNATADVADISATSDGQVLRRSGATLGFGALSLTSTGTVSGLTPQQVLYGGASGQVAQSANLTFNGTNLALGAVTPVSMIEAPSSSTNSTLKIGKAEVQSFTGLDANVLYTSNAYFNSSWTRRDAGYAGALQLYNGTFLFNTSETSSTAGSTYTPRTIITGSTSGYVNVGNIAAGTITVPLGVRGFGATSSTGALHVQNSTPATILFCRDDKNVGIGTSSPGYNLDVTSSATSSQLHFSGTGADNGGYLVSAGASNFFMAAGASWNGSNWVAKATSASIIGGGATAGQLTFYSNTGLTIGNTFTVTERAKIDEDGDFVVGVSTAAARVHSKGAGSTSATYSGLFENSSGIDALTIRDDTKVGVATATPNRTLEISGEVRITDLVTDTPTKIVGADADGDLDTIGINGYNELHITNGALGTNFHTTISPATLTAITNNWNPTGLATAWIIELSGNGSFVLLTGITAPSFNKTLTLYNNGDNSILLPREFSTSSAGNRFAFEIVLFPGKQIEIRYSVSEARWLLKSKAGAYEDVQEFYANHMFQSPVSITTGDFDFWEINSEAAASIVSPASNAWSGVSVNTSTSAGGLGYISSKERFFQTDNSSGSATWAYCKAVIRTPASLSDGTNDYTIRIGFNEANGGGGATDGMYFSYNHSVVSGNWGAATTNAGNTQMNNSGIAVTTNTTYVLEVYVQPSSVISFFINGVRVATNDTFVSTGDDMYAIAEIEKSVGIAQRDLIIYTLQASAAFVNNP